MHCIKIPVNRNPSVP